MPAAAAGSVPMRTGKPEAYVADGAAADGYEMARRRRVRARDALSPNAGTGKWTEKFQMRIDATAAAAVANK